MKMLNMAVVAAVLAAAAPVRAEDLKVDFDGGKGASGFTEALKAAAPAPAAVPAPKAAKAELPAAPDKGFKIGVTLTRSGSIFKDTLLCLKGENGNTVKECRKGSDGRALTRTEIDVIGIERLLMPEEPAFSGLIEKSRFCHNVTEECDRWKTVSEKVCAEYAEDSHGHQGRCLSYDTQEYDVCTHYARYCQDEN